MAALWPDKGGIGQDGHLFAAVSDRDWALGGAGAAHSGTREAHQLAQSERRTVRQWVSNGYRRHPMVVPVDIEA